jgi:hypothetical protein
MTTPHAVNQHDCLTPHARAESYRAFVLRAVPRLLGTLDRDPLSPTFGSFDREHWAWKFRDFPVNMLQTGLLPLAMLYTSRSNPYAGQERLLEWILGAIDATLRRQHRNGAFDSVAPYSQDHGVTLALVATLASALGTLGDSVPIELRERVLTTIARGGAFAERSDEDYAFISNHQALFALAWQRAGDALGSDAYRARSVAIVDAIIAHQSTDGWYAEYGGPDPGYESLGLFYLAMLLDETPLPRLAESAARSVRFLAHCVHPDGSVGGAYGSRLTQLWYPGGFELLAGRDPLADRIASFVHARLERANVVTPDTVDTHNLPSLLYAYLVAANACDELRESQEPVKLPCEGGPLLRHYDASGITVAVTQHYHAVTNGRRGGVMTVCSRESESLVFEDSGVAIEAQGRSWTSAAPATVERVEFDAGASQAQSLVQPGAPRNAPITPAKFLILRILCFTAFRSLTLGKALRRMIVARLVTGRDAGPFRCQRTVRFGSNTIDVEDRVTEHAAVPSGRPRLTRGYQPFHMGSARYFHSRDLQTIPIVAWTSGVSGSSAGGGQQAVHSAGVALRWSPAGTFEARPLEIAGRESAEANR